MMRTPNSLISRVQKLLDDPTDPSEIARVAREYVKLCEQIEQRVNQFTRLIRDGHYYAAMDLEHLEPPLTWLIEQVRFPREQEWRRLLEQSGLPTFKGFNDHELKRVKEICSDGHTYQPTGYREYRKAMLLGNRDSALSSLRKLVLDNPRDLNAKTELTRIEKQVFEDISMKLANMIARGQQEDILKTVAGVLNQSWVTPLHSESWEKAHALFVEEENSKTEAQLRQYMAQIMVIQRVGSWKDAEPLIAKLKAFTKHSAFANWSPEDRGTLQAMLDWFQDQEQRHQLRENLTKQLQDLIQQLNPQTFDPAIRDLGKKQRTKVERSLLAEWTELQQQAPDLCDPHAFIVQGALRKLNETPAGIQYKGLSLLWLRAVSVLALAPMLILGVLLLINHLQEGARAALISSHAEQGEWTLAEAAIREWNERSTRFMSSSNPVRNHGAHREVAKINHRIQELRSRQGKGVELLIRAESALDRDPPVSELRRIQANIQLAEELLEPLLSSEDAKSLRIQLIAAKDRAEQSLVLKRSQTRSVIQRNLNELSAAVDRELSFDRSRISGVEIPIARIRNGLQQARIQLRQAFDDEGLADLEELLQSLEERVSQFEAALQKHKLHQQGLEISRSLSEYLRHIANLATHPFAQDPDVRAASKVWSLREDMEHPARALLMPDNPSAWNQFLETATRPLFPQTPDTRESQHFRQLLNLTFLAEIHHYELQRYTRGTPIGPKQQLFGYADMKTFREGSASQGRFVQTLQLMDETRVRSGGSPFSERVFVGTTDAMGRPWEGDFVTATGISPESRLFQDLPKLAGFDATTDSFHAPLLSVIDTVKDSKTDPIFKSFLTQELIQLMTFRVFDWGLNFTPSLQLNFRRLRGITGALAPYDWLRSSMHQRMRTQLESYYQQVHPLSYHDQATASRSLFRALTDQKVGFAGYVSSAGDLHLLDGIPLAKKLLGFNIEGRLTILQNPRSALTRKPPDQALPLSPLLYFQDSPAAILDRVASQVRFDIKSESFRPFLPAIFDE